MLVGAEISSLSLMPWPWHAVFLCIAFSLVRIGMDTSRLHAFRCLQHSVLLELVAAGGGGGGGGGGAGGVGGHSAER